MAKIPRINQGDRPSAVVGGVQRIDSLGGQLAEGAAKLADTGYGLAADAEAREAKRRDDALEAKKAITDFTHSTRLVAEYGERNFSRMAQFQEAFKNEPEKAIEPFIAAARKDAADALETAPNSTIGLQAARGYAAADASDLNAMHRWAQTQMSENAKGNVEVTANIFSAQSEQIVGGVDTLAAHLADGRERYKPVFTAALGGKGGADRLQRMQSDATFAYFSAKAVREPLWVSNEIEKTTGPAAEFLDKDQRASLERITKTRARELPLTRQFDALKKGLAQNSLVGAQIMSGEMDPRDMMNILHAAEAERDVLKLDKTIGAEEKQARLATMEDRLKFLKAAQDFTLSQASFDLADKPGVAAEITANQAKIIKAVGGKVKLRGDNGLSEVLKQQSAIFEGILGGAIPKATGKALIRQLEQAMPAGYEKEAKNTGSVWGFQLPWADANEVGNLTLDREFKAAFPKATQAQRNIAASKLVISLTELADSGTTPTKADAHRLARESVALTMRKDPGNVFAGKAKR